jgi:hypothetical protein
MKVIYQGTTDTVLYFGPYRLKDGTVRKDLWTLNLEKSGSFPALTKKELKKFEFYDILST